MNYQDALDQALTLADDRRSLDAFLDSVPQWRTDLEGALAVSGSLSRQIRAVQPDQTSRLRTQQQLRSAVSRRAAAEAEPRASWLAETWRVLTFPRFIAAAAVAGALLVSALVVNLPGSNGGGTPTAEAVVIEGSVAEVGSTAMTVSTNEAAKVVTLTSDTVLLDGFGNTVNAADLSTGQDVVLKGSSSGEEFVASEVELRDRLFGVVTALPGDSIHLSSPKGDFVIQVTPETRFEGAVSVGAAVEIKLVRLSDGSLNAVQVEVEDEHEEDQEGDGDPGGASSGSGSTAPSVSSEEPGSSSGGGAVQEDGGSSSGSHEDDGGHTQGDEEDD
jgi:hypothetical protein